MGAEEYGLPPHALEISAIARWDRTELPAGSSGGVITAMPNFPGEIIDINQGSVGRVPQMVRRDRTIELLIRWCVVTFHNGAVKMAPQPVAGGDALIFRIRSVETNAQLAGNLPNRAHGTDAVSRPVESWRKCSYGELTWHN